MQVDVCALNTAASALHSAKYYIKSYGKLALQDPAALMSQLQRGPVALGTLPPSLPYTLFICVVISLLSLSLLKHPLLTHPLTHYCRCVRHRPLLPAVLLRRVRPGRLLHRAEPRPDSGGLRTRRSHRPRLLARAEQVGVTSLLVRWVLCIYLWVFAMQLGRALGREWLYQTEKVGVHVSNVHMRFLHVVYTGVFYCYVILPY